MPGTLTLSPMGRKRKSDTPADKKSGEHKKPRQMVGIPKDWYKVAQSIARKRPTPTLWWIIALIKSEAEKEGISDLPPTPWETEQS